MTTTRSTSSTLHERFQRRLGLRLRRRQYHRSQPLTGHHHGPGALQGAEVAGADFQEVVDQQRDQMVRLQAEFENYRRRTKREFADFRKTANSKLLESLLPVMDNFSRALENPVNSLEGFTDGVKMIHSLLVSQLKEAGLEIIEALGEDFDPQFHEAVMVDTESDEPENQIVEVLQEGFMIKGKLLRPAMVKVARKG